MQLNQQQIIHSTPHEKINKQRKKHKNDVFTRNFYNVLAPYIAQTQAQKEQVFNIRHHVYCEELGYEATNSDAQETDEFDPRSYFALIKHISSDTMTSCVRLITCQTSAQKLPIEHYCNHAISDKTLHPSCFDHSEVGEISRLAIKSQFRRRHTDTSSIPTKTTPYIYSGAERRCFSFIAIALYMILLTICTQTGIKHLYALMEPRLARNLKMMGITVLALGDSIEHRGLRAPYYFSPARFKKEIPVHLRGLFSMIEQDIKQQLTK